MAGQARDLRHAGVFPDHDLVLAIAVRADDLIAVLAPIEIADLRPCIDFLDHLARGRVPELDAAIGGSASRS